MLSQERRLKREKGEAMTDSKVTVLHTDVECRELLPLRTITAITRQSNLKVTRNLRGRRDPRIRGVVGSDEI